MNLDNLIATARSDIGLTANDPAFADVIAYGETDARRAEFMRYASVPWGSFSCCGLAAIGWVRREGHEIELPRSLRPPYRAPWENKRHGGAVSDLIEDISNVRVGDWTQEHVAAVDPGRLLIVGAGDNLHVYLVETVHDDYMNEIHLDAIESGVRDKRGVQCVKRRRHIINENGYDSVVENGVLVNQRKVAYILNPGVL